MALGNLKADVSKNISLSFTMTLLPLSTFGVTIQ